MAKAFIQDIVQGIAGTGIKAGAIKLATDTEGAPDTGQIAPFQEKCLRAIARAHRATGIPIVSHNGPPTTGRTQQRLLKEEGVELDGNVIIGHVGDTEDVGFLKELIDQGGFLGMDRFGLYTRLSLEARVKTIATLCKDGYADRLTLSHDANCYLDWVADFSAMQRNNPAWKIAHVAQEVLPALREAGVTDAQIKQMMVDNPRRLLEPTKPY
jgi:phosphotriesterase-related protein